MLWKVLQNSENGIFILHSCRCTTNLTKYGALSEVLWYEFCKNLQKSYFVREKYFTPSLHGLIGKNHWETPLKTSSFRKVCTCSHTKKRNLERHFPWTATSLITEAATGGVL